MLKDFSVLRLFPKPLATAIDFLLSPVVAMLKTFMKKRKHNMRFYLAGNEEHLKTNKILFSL